jgi:YbgC/YbaW family acyl-CoA thioester hydrolase
MLNHDEYSTHVELADTDAFGVIFWGAPVRWVQRGYENLMRAAGHPIERMLHLDHDHPVVNASIQFLRPLRLGNRIQVRTEIAQVGNRSFHVRTRVFGMDGEVAIDATCVHVAASRNGGPAHLGEWLRRLARST